LKLYPVAGFYGELGAGKTTLIQETARLLGVEQPVTSPTFALVNEYRTTTGYPVYHFDFYRIEDSQEALDFGLEEYLDSGYPCLMEWPERIASLWLPGRYLEIFIEIESAHFRSIRIQLPADE
ncbi:MAG: tRNA (adenosine(37)-N6)-threonylcarbamoyltransferase complex ATPase subunit type 1 TsaE, partial [Bacteroidales bacterium]|nr:tRNA (adenosine(37)-N6)-threonylcarbamoyltransferase complex ATPase subunit type 1 TsaE [Bacteroidales bacterium]